MRSLLVLCFATLFSAGAHAARGSCASNLAPELRRVAQGVNTLSAELSPLLAAADPGKNIVYSTANILSALHLLNPGASGPARAELARLMNLGTMNAEAAVKAFGALLEILNQSPASEGGTRIRTSASLWANRADGFEFKPDYVVSLRPLPGVFVSPPLDFASPAAAVQINRSVAEATEGLIPNMIEQPRPEWSALLISTLFIEGKWLVPFEPYITRDAQFTRLSGATVSVKMMRTAEEFEYGRTRGSQTIRLYTKDRRAYVEFTLPVPDPAIDPAALRLRFLADPSQVLPAETRTVRVALRVPRFRVKWKDDLTRSLHSLAPGLFSLEGLLGLGSPPVLVSQVLHESVLEINEGGFRGAAATSVAVGRGMPPRPEAEMIIDHSFGLRVVALADGEPVELFRGWIDDPEPLP